MAKITLDLGGSGPALQTEDEEENEKTRKRRPGNRKTTRREGNAARVQGMEGVVCMRVCECTYMTEPHVALGDRQVQLYGEAA